MALLSTTVRDNWWCICHFSLQRDFANVKGIRILEANYNRTGHIIYQNSEPNTKYRCNLTTAGRGH